MLNSFFFILFACGLCFFDVIAVGFLGTKIILSLLCLYSTLLFTPKKMLVASFTLVLLVAQTMMLGGSWGVYLFILLSLSALALEVKSLLNNTCWLPYAFLICAIYAVHAAQSSLPILSVASGLFVFKQICVNLLLLVLFEKTLSQR